MEVLKKLMAKYYQLEMSLNTEDLDMLSRFMACENPQWQDSRCIHLEGDNQIPRGTLHTHRTEQSIATDRAIIHAMDNLMADASTK